MAQPGDIFFEKDFELLRPKIRRAEVWVEERLSPDGTLDRACFSPADLKPFISWTSLFSLLVEDDHVTDLVIRVLSTEIASHFGESSGKRGSEALPPQLFERWIQMGQFVYDSQHPICVRSRVEADRTKVTETLVVPVRVNGRLEQALTFSEFWYDRAPL